MRILQVVGFKDSGKTTLVCGLVKKFTTEGLKVGSLKHHGHGGKPQGWQKTDSAKHLQAGAMLAGVEGAGVFELETSSLEWELEKLIPIYQYAGVEIMIIEGYKQAAYPKIVMLRNPKELALLESVTNCMAVVSDEQEARKYSYPVYSYSDTGDLLASIDIADL
ncbi:molybdopterin-guanine dinucleotide biosynthesis protein B [Terribacillus sp. 179-K 1B1 HS]|uniref:molybdopterin-guanine dinucleotide biosynthesis protein B n=1 Tax=Terribacillus sp. 179-K 1B1 HS TaxID=3142388 RepID=UPI0039A2F94B